MSRALQFLLVIAVLFTCPSECNAQWARVDKNTIKLNGDMGRDAYRSYLDAAKGGYSKVLLQSAGGSPMPALMVAQDMLKYRPEIVVQSYCFSACANYLLMASPAPVVECGAVVIWHGSPSNDFATNIEVMRLQGKNEDLIKKYEEWSGRFAALENAYFSAVKVNKKILSDSVAIVNREHVAPAATFEFDETTGDYSETVSSGLWIPSVKVMRSYGIQTRNFCRTYDTDIAGSLKRLGINAPYTTLGP